MSYSAIHVHRASRLHIGRIDLLMTRLPPSPSMAFVYFADPWLVTVTSRLMFRSNGFGRPPAVSS